MSQTPLNSAAHDPQLVSALSEFSTTLFKTVSAENGLTENVFMSPFSIAAVLLMAYVGAKGNTATQIKKSLNLNKFTDEEINSAMGNLIQSIKSDGKFTFESVNQLYVANQFKLLDTFQSTLKSHFGAQAESVDFAADDTRVSINKRVEQFTNNTIKNLLESGSISGLTRLVLLNAVYFQGNWKDKFNPDLTKTEPFFLNSKDAKINVEMMHDYGTYETGTIDSLDARVIELPYSGYRMKMLIILPNKVDGLAELESKIPSNFLNEIDPMLTDMSMKVSIPKFKIEVDVPAKNLLVKMGIADLFDSGTADLSGISGQRDLFASDIFQKAFIEVDEKGSTASAATFLEVIPISASPEGPPFVVDHPAIFLIKDSRTKSVLFIGRLANPTVA